MFYSIEKGTFELTYLPLSSKAVKVEAAMVENPRSKTIERISFVKKSNIFVVVTKVSFQKMFEYVSNMLFTVYDNFIFHSLFMGSGLYSSINSNASLLNLI